MDRLSSALAGVGVESVIPDRLVTKTLTAVLVLQLRDKSRLDLADPVGTFLPDCGYPEATLRELLAHTGGPAERAGRPVVGAGRRR